MGITKQVRWLHISDIHFRAKTNLDQNDAFKRIHSDVNTRKSQGRSPDLIFVTGDITYSGQPSDFVTIAGLLDHLRIECGLSRERVFFCPGNHDSDIMVAPVLLKGCWNSFQNVATFQSFLETAEYSALKERQAAYRSFVQSFRGDSGGFDVHDLHAVAHVTVGNLDVGILSTNSALLADGGSSDHGHLEVCIRVLEESCKALQESDLVIALIHHPFEWLAEFEADRAEAVVFDAADLVLRGHLHEPKFAGSLRGTITSAVGAVWDKTAGDYQYGFGCLTLDTLNCDIESVRFVQQTGKWMHSEEQIALARSRDERCTPGAMWAELRNDLTFPAQIAAALSGFASELMTTSSGRPQYLSTERILADSVKLGKAEQPALGVIRVGTLLMFYGHAHVADVLRAELSILKDYDRALHNETLKNADFASGVRAREAAATTLADTASDGAQSWTEKLLGRLVSEGHVSQISALRDDAGGSILTKLKAALTAGGRDPYEAWRAINGPALDYSELATVATRLAVRGTADLAALALSDAATRFPVESRQLDSLAKVIATELADPTMYTAFRKAVDAR